MVILYNIALIIVGALLLSVTILFFMLIYLREFDGVNILATPLFWLAILVLFWWFYRKRTEYMENTAIVQSWSSFKAYMIEGHSKRGVSIDEKEAFFSYLNKYKDIKTFRDESDVLKFLYKIILDDDRLNGKNSQYVKYLALYFYDWYSD